MLPPSFPFCHNCGILPLLAILRFFYLKFTFFFESLALFSQVSCDSCSLLFSPHFSSSLRPKCWCLTRLHCTPPLSSLSIPLTPLFPPPTLLSFSFCHVFLMPMRPVCLCQFSLAWQLNSWSLERAGWEDRKGGKVRTEDKKCYGGSKRHLEHHLYMF